MFPPYINTMKMRSCMMPCLMFIYRSSREEKTAGDSFGETRNTCSGAGSAPDAVLIGNSRAVGSWTTGGAGIPIRMAYMASGISGAHTPPFAPAGVTLGSGCSLRPGSVLTEWGAGLPSWSEIPVHCYFFQRPEGRNKGSRRPAGTEADGMTALKKAGFPTAAPGLLGLAGLMMRRRKR